jgi:hypothetical protein
MDGDLGWDFFAILEQRTNGDPVLKGRRRRFVWLNEDHFSLNNKFFTSL